MNVLHYPLTTNRKPTSAPLPNPDILNTAERRDDAIVEVQFLAKKIRRSESAICLKIGNFKACDPNRTGLDFSNAIEIDVQMIGEYLTDHDMYV